MSDEHLSALAATLTLLENDEYVKFKYGVSLRGARKALDKLLAGREVPTNEVLAANRAAREALDKAIALLEKGGGGEVQPKRRRAKPEAAPGVVAVAPGSPDGAPRPAGG